MKAVDLTNVTKTYGEVEALHDVTMSVEKDTSFGLLGTNGAGKTTLFKLLVSHMRPDSGTVEVDGVDVTQAGSAIRQNVGYLPESSGFPPSLTGREVLRFHARMRGIDAAERVSDVLETVGLSDASTRSVSGYSNGMTRRLGLAAALLGRPEILLLDEPTAGLDPRGVRKLHDVVERLRRQTEMTVVVSSHALGEVERLCDSVAVLHDGRLRLEGSIPRLRASLDDGVSLRVYVDDAETAARVLAEGAEVERVGDERVEARCDSSDVCDLLGELRGSVTVDGFEVEESGLEDVFERVLQEVGK